jgi:glycosyltransferase involved in cell wall biosynthesis
MTAKKSAHAANTMKMNYEYYAQRGNSRILAYTLQVETGEGNRESQEQTYRKLNVIKGLPLSDRTADHIHVGNIHKNLAQADLLGLLRECRRALKISGIVRVATSDSFEGQMTYHAQLAGLLPSEKSRTEDGADLIFTLPGRTAIDSPLVSILIPAYRSRYFGQALKCALDQTYSNAEIVISDDSPDEDIRRLVDEIGKDDKRIKYVKNTQSPGELGNYLNCFALAQGEYIKYLNDDDLLSPNCVERMVRVFKEHPDVTLVTSYRRRIDSEGKPLDDVLTSRCFVRRDSEMEGISCANALIRLSNFIGEPTTTMFRKSDLDWVKPHFAFFGDADAVGAGDVAMWLYLLGRGNAFYITEPLSSFRIHSEQSQNQPHYRAATGDTWKRFVTHGKKTGLMKSRWSTYIWVRTIHGGRWKRKQIFVIKLRQRIRALFNSILRVRSIHA